MATAVSIILYNTHILPGHSLEPSKAAESSMHHASQYFVLCVSVATQAFWSLRQSAATWWCYNFMCGVMCRGLEAKKDTRKWLLKGVEDETLMMLTFKFYRIYQWTHRLSHSSSRTLQDASAVAKWYMERLKYLKKNFNLLYLGVTCRHMQD